MGGRGASSGGKGGGGASGGLPALTGSQKQIDWASKIRSEKMQPSIDMVNKSNGAPDAKKAYKDWITWQTKSDWWIDRSKYTPQSFVQEFAQGYLKSKK